MSGVELGLDVLHVHDDVALVLPFGRTGREVFLLGGDFATQVLEALLAGLVGFLLKGLLLDLHLGQTTLCGVELLRLRVNLDAQTAGCLVHEVDGLVGQEPVGDVAVGKLGCRHDSAVGDANAVMDVVFFLETAQDGDGVLDGGLGHQHRLEPALESRVFLDVLPVLVERRGADRMQLATCEGGFEHVARIDRAVAARACAHDGVQLVDEQDDAPVGVLHLAQHGLQPILELAAVLGAGEHRGDVERDDVAVLQAVGHVARHDALGEPLDDRRLAGARLADEHGVVLRAARQHLDGAADFLVPPDDGVELALTRLLGKVLTILVQGVELHLRRLVGHALVAAQLVVGLLDRLGRDAGGVEHAPGIGLVSCQRDEQMLGGGVAITHALGDLLGRIDDLDHVVARGGYGHTAARFGLCGDCCVHRTGQCRRVRPNAPKDRLQVVFRCV